MISFLLLAIAFAPCETAPVVDGAISAHEYDRGTSLSLPGGTAFFAADRTAFHFAWRSAARNNDPGGGMVANFKKRDDPLVCADDVVELILENPENRDAFHISINAIANVFDRGRKAGSNWDNAWNCAGLKVESVARSGVWELEASIPLETLGVTAGRLRANVLRETPGERPWAFARGSDWFDGEKLELDWRSDVPCIHVTELGDPASGVWRPEIACTWAPPGAKVRASILMDELDKDGRTVTNVMRRMKFLAPGVSLKGRFDTFARADYSLTFEVANPADRTVIYGYSLTANRGAKVGGILPYAEFDLGTKACGTCFYYPGQGRARFNLVPNGTFAAAAVTVDGVTHPLAETKGGVWTAIVDVPTAIGSHPVSFAVDGQAFENALQLEAKSFGWERNDIGKDRIVLPPFEPIRASGASADILLRRYGFNGAGLLKSVTAKGRELLADEVHFEVVPADQSGKRRLAASGEVRIQSSSDGYEAAIGGAATADGLGLKSRGHLEYDGFVWNEVTVDRPATVDRLTLVVPLKDAEAPLYHVVAADTIRHNPTGCVPSGDGLVFDSSVLFRKPESAEDLYAYNAVPYVWLGAEERGLCWFVNDTKGLSLDPKKGAVRLVRKDGVLRLECDLVSRRTKLAAGHRFTFGLQATPVKTKDRALTRHFQTGSASAPGDMVPRVGIPWRETSFSNHWARVPWQSDWSKFDAAAQRPGIYPFKYSDPTLTWKDDEAVRHYRSEWVSRVTGYEGAVRTFLVPSSIDYVLYRFREWMAHGLKGLYFDDMYLIPCRNADTSGGSFGILEMRELVKRAAVMQHVAGLSPRLLQVHMTNALIVPSFAFATSLLTWEDHYGEEPFPQKFPVDYVRAESMGTQVGCEGIALDGVRRKATPEAEWKRDGRLAKLTRSQLATLLPAGMSIWYRSKQSVDLDELFAAYGEVATMRPWEEDCTFIPFWQRPLDVPDGVIAGLYRRGGERLAVFGNQTGETKTFACEGRTVELAPWDYAFERFSGKGSFAFPISNHDQSPSHAVAMPLVGVTNRVIDCRGRTLRTEPGEIALLVKDAANVTIRNLTIDAVRPCLTEMRVVGFESGETLVEIDESRYPVALEDGRLVAVGAGMHEPVVLAKTFDGRTREMIARSGDTRFDGAARKVRPGVYALKKDFSTVGAGVKAGDVIVFRPKFRRAPAMVVIGSKDVRFEDVIVHDAEGMGLLAELSENVSWRGTKTAADRTSGVFPSEGRYSSTHADATHFSNVRGKVAVENCFFEGMMDDAINVHSTGLRLTAIGDDGELTCSFMHPQSVGLDLFRAGDGIRFIRASTFEYGPTATVKAARLVDGRTLSVRLEGTLPKGFGVGDTIESATWQPASVAFRFNEIRNNRARGTLFACPGRVEVVSNLYDHVSGAAILLAGDANKWYETGGCRNVSIRGNVFRDCLATTTHGHSLGVVVIDPSVPDPARQSTRCHRRITIEDNWFDGFDTTLLYANSAADVTWRNNRVDVSDRYPGWGKPRFVVKNSDRVSIDEEGENENRSPWGREILDVELKDGPVAFDVPRDGWVWFAFDRDHFGAEARLDGSAAVTLIGREGEPPETMRYLEKGPHRLDVSGSPESGRLTVRLVPRIVFTDEKALASELTDLSSGTYGWEFVRRWLLPIFNEYGSTGIGEFADGELRLRGRRPSAGPAEGLELPGTNGSVAAISKLRSLAEGGGERPACIILGRLTGPEGDWRRLARALHHYCLEGRTDALPPFVESTYEKNCLKALSQERDDPEINRRFQAQGRGKICEKEREGLKDITQTRPDFLCYVPDQTFYRGGPKRDPAKRGDSYNDHFQVLNDDARGLLYAFWTQASKEADKDQHIVFSKSADRGRTWTHPVLLAGSEIRNDPKPLASWQQPMLAKSGRLYCLWNQQTTKYLPHRGEIFGRYSDDGGESWSEPKKVKFPHRANYDSPDPGVPPSWCNWQRPLRLGKDGRFLVASSRNGRLPGADRNQTAVEVWRFENIDADPEVEDIVISAFMRDERSISISHLVDEGVRVFMPNGKVKTTFVEEGGMVRLPDGRLFMLCRSSAGYPVWSVSADGGENWSRPRILRDRDGGRPILHPTSPCPIYDVGGPEAGSGEYAAFVHGTFDFSAERSLQRRGPLYRLRGRFDAKAEQPIAFDYENRELWAPGVAGQSWYASCCRVGDRTVMWYNDRKYFLLGRFLDD